MNFFKRTPKTNCCAEQMIAANHLQFPIHPIGNDRTMFDERQPVARVNVSTDPNENISRNVYQHDLKTYDILPEEISLLNALYLDALWGHSGEEKYPSNRDRFNWLSQTHPYTSRGVDVEIFSRWGSFFSFLAFERR